MTIEVINGTLIVNSEYNSDFVEGARKLNGRWSGGAWHFDPRVREEVEALCLRCYGQNSTVNDLVNIHVEFTETKSVRCGPISINGRTLARAMGRDSGAKLGDGVVIVEGKIGSGGSAKNWETYVGKGTKMRIFDFPRAAAENLIANPPSRMIATIEAPEVIIDTAALEEERDRLLARLAEIEALIGPKVAHA